MVLGMALQALPYLDKDDRHLLEDLAYDIIAKRSTRSTRVSLMSDRPEMCLSELAVGHSV